MKLNSDISAVITGGASGLGAATARLLASHGVKVAIFDMNEAVGQALASELGGVYCNVDVTSEEQVDAAFAKARAAIGQERVLVNCAGTADAVKTVSRDKKTGEIRPCAADRGDAARQMGGQTGAAHSRISTTGISGPSPCSRATTRHCRPHRS